VRIDNAVDSRRNINGGIQGDCEDVDHGIALPRQFRNQGASHRVGRPTRRFRLRDMPLDGDEAVGS
jgi:hypothetical protein